jgi:G3E family GTPase
MLPVTPSFFTTSRFVFQGVHMLMGFGSSSDGTGRPWGKDETRENRIIFIGRNLDREQLTADFKKCLA